MSVDDGGHLKMYILIRESVPTGFAVLAAAHASLAAYLKFRAPSPPPPSWTCSRVMAREAPRSRS
ncbi:hypothetical protein JQX13_22320 [Archangium violaceum]|uniref:hypothetical protein n=1 Tax=Archangium violaceum TaxID=83451 RepID=UPI00193C39FD|nr:hypothetical protein [Archangium violaceum]QRK12518.1 hypothetical protein JQX13_22320 [Archangium violaceum]